jgi:transcriptional regulator with XRE-family HTH domain
MLKKSSDHSFADRLVQERLRLGVSRAALARRLGVSNPSQLAYEKGTHAPPAPYFAALYDAGIDAVYVYLGFSRESFGEKHLDWSLLSSILTEIEKQLTTSGENVALEERLVVARVVYARYCEERQTTFHPNDVHTIRQLLSAA